jgi:transcriptional regulator with XRE-family HTH domain
MSSSRERFAMKLKQLRKPRRMTQEALARKANISLGFAARLEIGRHDPKLSTLSKLAKALRVKATVLVG